MLNSWTGMGRLAADPELAKTKTGKSVVSIRIAVQRDTSKYTEDDNVDWINLVFWDRLAENLSRLARKGDMIVVSGRLQSRRYEDTKRIDHIVYEVCCDKFYFPNRKTREEPAPALGDPVPNRRRKADQGVNVWTDNSGDGDLPF